MENIQEVIISTDVDSNKTLQQTENKNSKNSDFQFNWFEIGDLFDI